MTSYTKLVRDKIPEILDGKGVSYEKRIADEREYKIELVKKLKEEAEEFFVDLSVEELADVAEVLEAIKNLPEYANLEEVRINKRKEGGGFDERIILSGEK